MAQYGIGAGSIDWLRRPGLAPANGIVAKTRVVPRLFSTALGSVVAIIAVLVPLTLIAVGLFRIGSYWPLLVAGIILLVAIVVAVLPRTIRVDGGRVSIGGLGGSTFDASDVAEVVPIVRGAKGIAVRDFVLRDASGAVLGRIASQDYGRDDITKVLGIFAGRYGSDVPMTATDPAGFEREHPGLLSWWRRSARWVVIAGLVVVVVLLVVGGFVTPALA